ncbi:MAG: sel1 repeat family protein [Alphaproteobacteria bacterium]|nr:sel1 repeat family protein [Alphaproteobacteria bacterium]
MAKPLARIICVCGAATMLLAGCELTSLFGNDSDKRPTQGAQAEQYQKAIEYKEKSDCPRAIPLLEPLANRGHGFEVAQFQLGQCYIETARSAASPADAERARADGASWILKAANSQNPAAQQEAIRLYEEGIGVASDAAEAGKWFLVLQRNPMRRLYGPAVIEPDLEQRLNKRLTPQQWSDARARADHWQPVEQPTVLPPPEPKSNRRG